MDRSATVDLIVLTQTQDDIGQFVSTETKKTVFCNRRSVSRDEFFAAAAQGLSPQFVLSVFAPDYSGEEICEFEGNRYSIYRTYVRQDENIELYLHREGGTA